VNEHLATGSWPDLVTAALVGTDRGAGSGPDGLLDSAARLTVARRVGRLPATAIPPDPCEENPRPVTGPAASDRIAAMVAGHRSVLIAEWLTAADARGRRPPDHLLPALLDLAAGTPRLRPLLARHPRVRWLARLNPAWDLPEFADPSDDTPWRLGTRTQRRAWLAAVRETDPARARQLLADPALSAAERAAFLPVLAARLSPADEEYLEAALDDRAAPVRAAAADLLTRLQGSGYQTRMTSRARHLLREQGGRLVVTPPEPAPRDAITGTPRQRVIELVARTPPAAWGAPPREADYGEWEPELLAGWVRAAATFGDQDWTLALTAHLLRARRAGRPSEQLHALLDAAPVPWPAELTELVLTDGAPAGIIAMAAHRGDPAFGDVPPRDDDPEPLRILRFRCDMLKELDD
jgi:hypothetical protein